VDETGRGAFYFAAEAASLFMVFKTQAKLSAARRGVPVDSGLVASRSQQREDWIALSIFWAALGGVDAWVSAHLWHFEGELTPPEEGVAGAGFKVQVPVGSP